MKWILWFSVAVALQSCGDDGMDLPAKRTEIIIGDDQVNFEDVIQNGSGDDFELMNAELTGGLIKMTVAYPGGCKDHEFNFAARKDENSGFFELVAVHDANDDSCEAYLTDTLEVNINELNGLSGFDKSEHTLRVYNGSELTSVLIHQEKLVIKESEDCDIVVSTEDVICGDGLFDNRWFKYNPDDGSDSFFLQPVSIAKLIQLNPELEPGDYRIGVKYTSEVFNDPDKAICLAFPGPSIPVTIWCLEKIE